MFAKMAIRKKIVLSHTLVFGFLLVTIALASMYDIEREQMRMVEMQLNSYSGNLKSEIMRQIYEGTFPDQHKLFEIKGEGLIDPQFKIVDDKLNTAVQYKKLLSSFSAEQIKTLLKEKWIRIGKESSSYYCNIIPVELGTQKKYYVITSASLAGYKRQVHFHFFFFLIAVPLALFLATAAAYYISRISFKPITRMIDTAKQISAKDLHKRIEVSEAKDEIRELGETLNGMIERLESSFESQKRFIADASHEIKTPLTIIHANLELIQEKISDQKTIYEIDQIIKEVDRLNNLSNSLLKLAKLEAGNVLLNIKLIRLDEIILEVVQAFQKISSEKQLSWNLQVDEPIEITADEELLKSVFTNVIDNAVKYSFPNTTVHISIKKLKTEIIVKIVDKGVIIDQEEIDHIFRRFYRSNEIRGKIQGSGLGLSIAENIIKLHKGIMILRSGKDKQTEVEITLPIKLPV
ncbi:MAG: HAMP domain-containing sensor histidine kinase [Ignavibacteria bacterium]|nr:HAMP domain-containing sensor histidine kinase [Ignavibacteria bacterium]